MKRNKKINPYLIELKTFEEILSNIPENAKDKIQEIIDELKVKVEEFEKSNN